MSSLFNIAAGGSSSSDFYSHEIGNSLRFDEGNSARLFRTPSSEGNRSTFTISMWVKRADLGQTTRLFMATTNATNARYTILEFNSTDTIRFYGGTEGTSALFNIQTNAQFRDMSAWYHIVAVMDTTQSTSTNRMKLYVNGTQITSLATSTYGSQNAEYAINDDIIHYVNFDGSSLGSNYSDLYIAEFNFIDGQALNPTSFGETKSGVWIPKEYTGSYGTNGFHLEFGDSSAIGDDTSGNANDFTTTNLNVFDVVPDSPTNNFSVLNSQIGKALSTYVDPRHGNLEIDTTDGGRGTTFSTMAMPTGTGEKYYAEYRYRADSGHMRVGIISVDQANDYLETNNFDSPTTDNVSYTSVTGKIAVNGGEVEVVATYTVGDVIGMAVDLENGTIQFSKNGSNVGSAVSQSFISSNEMLFAAGDSSTSQDIRYSANFGQDSTFAGDETAATNADTNGIGAFHSSVPSGFKALCAKNLPEPTITPKNDDIPEDYFNTVLYTGDDSTSQAITGVGFQPDWVWIKARNSSSLSHGLLDSVRGVNKSLFTNSTTLENTGVVLPSFDSDGFTVSDSGGNWTNDSFNYVSWNWLAGTAFSNSAGANGATIASSGQVNTQAGFAIISHTGTGSAGTIAHGLGKKPAWIMTKLRSDSGDGWLIYHHGLNKGVTPEQKYIVMSSTSGIQDNSIIWNDTAPTTSVYSVGTSNAVNGSTETYISYVFAEIEGYSKFGFYEGNGNTDGQYIYTGFRPAMIIVKQTDTSNRWIIFDNKRGSQNESDTTVINHNPLEEKLELNPDDATEESTSGTDCFDFYSNGFKLRRSGDVYNGNGHDYIYMAWAEIPFKYANAR